MIGGSAMEEQLLLSASLRQFLIAFTKDVSAFFSVPSEKERKMSVKLSYCRHLNIKASSTIIQFASWLFYKQAYIPSIERIIFFTKSHPEDCNG